MQQKGFTLIELMIIVALIGILAAIGISQYQRFIIDSSNNACLTEARGFSGAMLVSFSSGLAQEPVIWSACNPPAVGAGVPASGVVAATPPNFSTTPSGRGAALITCAGNAACSL